MLDLSPKQQRGASQPAERGRIPWCPHGRRAEGGPAAFLETGRMSGEEQGLVAWEVNKRDTVRTSDRRALSVP